jgi:hypothetical protein
MSNNIGVSYSSSSNSTGCIGNLGFFITGIGIPKYIPNSNVISLGGGLKGRMTQSNINTIYDNEFSQTRYVLRDSWNTNNNNIKNIITPFRAINNAGDILSRQNYTCGGGSCQQENRTLKGLKNRFGNIKNTCIPSVYYSSSQLNNNIPSSTCNVKYVYDGSDYTKYLRQRSINKNYNNLSNGGDNNYGSQVTLKAIRRF